LTWVALTENNLTLAYYDMILIMALVGCGVRGPRPPE
jgi:hypothetical protein